MMDPGMYWGTSETVSTPPPTGSRTLTDSSLTEWSIINDRINLLTENGTVQTFPLNNIKLRIDNIHGIKINESQYLDIRCTLMHGVTDI